MMTYERYHRSLGYILYYNLFNSTSYFQWDIERKVLVENTSVFCFIIIYIIFKLHNTEILKLNYILLFI